MSAADEYYERSFATDGDDAGWAELEPPFPPDPMDDPGLPRSLRDAGDVSPAERQAERFERDVQLRMRQLEVQEQAARRLRAERAVAAPPVQMLADFLDRDLGEAQFRVERLWPAGGRVMLSAQFKAGKSTMVGNLVRSLADGVPFLEEYPAAPATGPIVLLDTELDERMLQEWFTRQGIKREDRVALVSLRGKVSSFDITDPQVRLQWADVLRELEPSTVILDCLRPVLDAIGLDEDKEAGRFLVAFDELLDRCGAGEAVVVHHMGHSGERSRGSSRLRDWPDVEWRLMRADPDDPSSPRYFTAYGRDVDESERQLTFNEELRRLSVFGGSRRDSELTLIGDDILTELETEPGLTTAKLEKRLGPRGHTRSNFRAALARLVSSRQVSTLPGRGTAVLHYLPGTVPPPGEGRHRAASHPN